MFIDIEKWINENKGISNLIIEIEALSLSIKEQTSLAFNRLPELLNIPMMPSDVVSIDENLDVKTDSVMEQRSLFEEFTYLNYLNDYPDDPRSLLLMAAYYIVHGYEVDLYDVANKEFSENIPTECQIGIKGQGIDGTVLFPQKEGKSWYHLGCVQNRLVYSH